MKLKNRLRLLAGAILGRPPEFTCPLCRYVGPFIATSNRFIGRRYHSACPECGARERHRLMAFVLADLLTASSASSWKVLHFAAERHIRNIVEPRVADYATSQFREGGDYRLDISNIELPDQSFDLVIASHVLEHVEHEQCAMEEVRRILRPGGYAVLPVPIFAETTIEYGRQLENWHYRAVGPDYFERLREVFSEVTVTSSADAPAEYQTYFLGRRNHWPTPRAPLLKPMRGCVFPEFVPVCRRQVAGA